MLWSRLQRRKKNFNYREIFQLVSSSLKQYKHVAPGNLIVNSGLPDWAKSFASLVSHLTPMIGSLVIMDPIKIPKQLKSLLGLALMYLSTWGRLDHYPRVAGITLVSSIFSDLTQAPNFIRRSLLAFLLSASDQFQEHKLANLGPVDLKQIARKFIPKVLEMELKINSSVPFSDWLAGKFSNKLISIFVQICGISASVTTITELLKRLGISVNNTSNSSAAFADTCPVCGEAHGVGECIASDIAPSLSVSAVA